MKDLSRHSKYIGNDPYLNKNFPRYMRFMNKKISKLLEGIDFTRRHGIDYHISKARPINKPGFLANFLKTHDNAQIYLVEAERQTIPTKEFINEFVKFCSEKLSKELVNVTFDQLYRDNDKNIVISSPPIIMDEDQVVSPMICLALPTYIDNASMTNALIREFTDNAVDDGYFLAYKPDNIECQYHDGLSSDVMISYLTFEAKYTSLDIDLNGNLFHVTTERALKQIANHGLIPKSESCDFSYPPRI